MSFLTKRETPDRSKINLGMPGQAKCWAHKLGISQEQLCKLIEKVGIDDPNVLGRFVQDGEPLSVDDDLSRYLGSYLAHIEEEDDVASVILEPLVREVGRVIGELKRSGLSILLVEQNLALALSVADRVHVLSRGQIVHSGTPAELMGNDDVKTRYLGVA